MAAPVVMGSAAASSAAASTAGGVSPATVTDVTTTGGTADYLPIFSGASTVIDSVVFQTGTGATAKVGINTITPAVTLDVNGTGTVRGTLTLPATAAATATVGKDSQPLSLTASAFNSTSSTALNQVFHLQAEPTGNDTTAPSGTLNLLFGESAIAPSETGFKISSKGLVTFATGQTFPGTGTGNGSVTSVGSGLGLTGGPITTSGTLAINTTVVPQLKANNSFTGTQSITGRLGINTTAPTQSLDVTSGNAIVRGPGNFETTGNTAYLYVGDTSHAIGALWGNGLAIGVYEAPSALFIQDKTGNVGIGTTTPTSGILTTVATSASVVGLSATGWTEPSSGLEALAGGDAVHATGGTGGLADNGNLGNGGAGLVGTGGSGTPAGTGVVANGGGAPSLGAGGIGIDATGGSGASFGGSGGSFIAGYGAYGGGDGIDAAAEAVSTSDAGFFTANLGGCDEGDCAGYFSGDINVTGAIYAGTKDFRIDHPLDPENKYLQHASVESSEMKNVYDGLVILDGTGEAVVQLPAWFEAVNGDFRYQLTAIGRPSPGLYIAQEISSNSFQIAGGTPGAKVSWQVTGVRHDPYAKAHPLVIEQQKNAPERGNYIHPELYGAPEERSIAWARHPVFMKRVREANAKHAAQRAAMETSAQRAAHTEAR